MYKQKSIEPDQVLDMWQIAKKCVLWEDLQKESINILKDNMLSNQAIFNYCALKKVKSKKYVDS
jgi:hypothetical protein